jgi:hypothetical protein
VRTGQVAYLKQIAVRNQSIIRCDVDIRMNLYSNSVPSDGTTMFAGIGERMSKEFAGMPSKPGDSILLQPRNGPLVLLTHAPTSHAAGHTVVPPTAADSHAMNACLEKKERETVLVPNAMLGTISLEPFARQQLSG